MIFSKNKGEDVSTIAIVGSGFSGLMVAVNLMRLYRKNLTTTDLTPPKLKINLIDKSDHFGRGIAYSTTDSEHLLNVPAARMSAFPEEPEHFLTWLQNRIPESKPSTYASRKIYGDYLNELYLHEKNQMESLPNAPFAIEHIRDEVTACSKVSELFVQLKFKSYPDMPDLNCHKVVLALGHFPSAAIGSIKKELGSYSQQADILIIGNGLTMVDNLISLLNCGHQGNVTTISRRGLLVNAHLENLPQIISKYQNYIELNTLENLNNLSHLKNPTLRFIVKKVRAEIKKAKTLGINWRAVIDSLRPNTQILWQKQLSPADKFRFLRHVCPYWDVARHRMAPEIGSQLEQVIKSGQLKVFAAKIKNIQQLNGKLLTELKFRGQESITKMHFDYILNCTGPQIDYRHIQSPIIASLLTKGLAQMDPTNLGLVLDPNGALINNQGLASEVFYTVGPLRKAQLWESIAVPELRIQAWVLAKSILNELSDPT